MSAKQDNDALSWAGDDDPTLVASDADGHAGPAPDESMTSAAAVDELPEGWTAVGTPAGAGSTTAADADAGTTHIATQHLGAADDAPPPSSVALVGMGVLGGIYMLYTVGWFIGTSRVGNPIVDPVGQFMFSLGAWLAVIAPLVWFGAVYWLTNDRPRLRMLWLLIGVVLLAPLPFIFGVGTV
ncbi:DNA polymerase III subunit gamma/tau [Leifsonia sp. YAF41]|uniref:DNA polymerase III subunit gamma/tau n=1 Tax=Leifsonia sp. YAF41 TaxID=3233086 RepID=UPI003F9C7BE2